MKKCYGYVRVSGKSQITGDGFKRQTEVIRNFANKSDHELIQIYQEKGISGELDENNRPSFQEMVTDILKNGINTIIIEGMDRLARELQIQTTLITYLASKGITLISANTGQDITEAVMNDPMQKALVQIQGVFAELEKNLLVKKLQIARERKKKETGRCEGRKPLQETNPEIIAEIKKLRRKPKGKKPLSYAKIAGILNSKGFTNTNNKLFSGNSVFKIYQSN